MNENKKIEMWGIWTAYMVYTMCTVSMTVMANVNGWPLWVYIQLWGLAVILAAMSSCRRVNANLKQICLMVFAMLDIFSCSILEEDIYPSIIVMCGCAVMISIYKNHKLLILQLIMSIAILLVHIFVLGTVKFNNGSEVTGFMMRVGVMLGSELYLFYFINRLNQTEEQLKGSLIAARNAENSKANFLANMSHEIRTPMNAIVGMCELILRENGVTDNIREHCYNIQNSGRSLLSIINDILDFSKIESGKMEIIEAEFNIASTINDCINIAVTRKGTKKLEIIVHADPDIPCGLIGDELRIRQIVINLVTNAIKFTNEGAVIIRFSQTRQAYGINLTVSVSDTGIGISEENLEKLFTSFQQVDTRKNRAVEGTGLGLAISKGFVTKMGGYINVSSKYGVGSEFKFVIPLKVSNNNPFISVKNRDNIHAVAYFSLDRFTKKAVADEYKKLLDGISGSLKTDFCYCDSIETFQPLVESGKITHCFVDREDYATHAQYFDSISPKLNMMIIQDRVDAIALPPGMKTIYKPFYILAIVSALNNENLVMNLYEHRESAIRFSAPKAKVLIVDDNVINLKVAVGLMRPYAMQLFTAESGREAISKLQLKDIDLVFMDHMMPEMDGVETTQRIRAMEGEYYKKLPIIALTANAVNGVRDVFLQSGFNDFLAKPIELSALDRILKSHLPSEYIQAPMENSLGTEETFKEDKGSDYVFFDSEKGLVYAGGNVQTYQEILMLFVEKFPEKSCCIESLFEKEDWKNYVIEVHALKSSAKSIGADSLSELAKELEFAGKDKKYYIIKEKDGELHSLYAATVEAISEYLGIDPNEKEMVTQTDISALPCIETDKLNEYAKAVIAACDRFDSDEIAKNVEALFAYSYKGFALRDVFAKVESLADDFEYEAAENEVKDIMQRIGGD